MGVDSGDLRSHVRAYAELFAAQVIGELEGFKIKIRSADTEQRVEMLDEGRTDLIVSTPDVVIDQRAAQAFELRGFGGQ
jgi:hypothetical protein